MSSIPVKCGTSSKGLPMHYSAGAFIKRGGKYLLLDRKNPPFGWAGPAGHVDEGEEPDAAVIREIKEETGLRVTEGTLLFKEEVENNECKRKITVHYWHLYLCEAEGEVLPAEGESKRIGWFSIEEIGSMELEPVWKHWFTKIGLFLK